MANKLTDEQFYAQMDKIKQLSGFNPFEGFADELYKQVGNLNPVSAFINNFSPEARAKVMQPMEQQVQQMPEVPYTKDGTFQSLAGSSQTGGHDIYSGSDPTDYGVAGGEQVSNMDKWVAENAVGATNILAQPEKLVNGLLDIGSGYYQKATGDITNQEQVDQANNTTQQFQEMFTPEGLHKGPDAVGLAAGGTYLAGKAGGWAGNKLESSGINDKIDAVVNDNPGLFPTELGGKSEMVLHHGSQSKFDKFDHDKMGSGEGNQSYGWGTYLAEHPDVAGGYQNRLSGNDKLDKLTSNGEPIPFSVKGDTSEGAFIVLLKNEGDVNKTLKELDDRATNSPIKGVRDKNAKSRDFLADYANNNDLKFDKRGSFYDVDVPDEYIDDMIDHDLDIASQSENVRDTLLRLRKEFGTSFNDGQGAYDAIVFEMRMQGHKNPEKAASEFLDKQGIKGIKFLDQDSRTREWDITPPDETVAGDWMIKDRRDPLSKGRHFDNEIDAQKYLEEKSKKTRNFVIFNEDNMKILRRDGEDINNSTPSKADDGLSGGSLPWNMSSKGDGDFYIQRVGPNAGKVSKTRNGPSDIAFSTDQDVLLPDYAYYAVMNLEKQLQARAHGTAQQAINKKDIDDVLTDFFNKQQGSSSKKDDGVLGQVDKTKNPTTDLRNSLREGGYKIDMDEGISGEIKLSRIEVPPNVRGKGLGSKAMEDIIKMADESGKTITLTPDTSFGATSVSRLKKFYKKFGFVENKGKNKDFLYKDSMLRLPNSPKVGKADDGLSGQTPEAVKTKAQPLERQEIGMGFEQIANDDIALVGGMRSGSSKGDETRLKYTIYDTQKALDNKSNSVDIKNAELGDIELFVEDGTGKIRGLVELNIKDKKKGTGRKVIEALRASDFVQDDFKIHSIKKSAVPFWKKMGVEFERKKPIGSNVGDGVIRKNKPKPKKVTDGLLKQTPLTVYRSSTSGSYDKFDKSKQRTSTLGKGVYMFDNEKGANDWVGGNLQKIELPYDYMEKSINWGDGGQSDFVTKAFKKIEKEVDFKLDLEDGGIDVYPELVKKLDEDKAQALLSKHGIYGNRRDGELTIFNVDDAKIISTDKKKPKNGLLD